MPYFRKQNDSVSALKSHWAARLSRASLNLQHLQSGGNYFLRLLLEKLHPAGLNLPFLYCSLIISRSEWSGLFQSAYSVSLVS